MALQLPNYPNRAKRQLYEFGAYIVNLVHDSLLIECPEDKATVKEVSRISCENAVQVPRQWGLNRVPFLADTKVGKRWGSLIPLEEWLAQ
jgi:DNA polymerase I-like protein with 3'-5' exonuclease and polymerase domains